MRHASLTALLACALLVYSGCRASPTEPEQRKGWEDEWHGHISWPVGYRRANDDFGDAQDQFAYGIIDFDIQPPRSPVAIVLQLLGSYSDNVADDDPRFDDADTTSVTQLNLGVRKYWYRGDWRPFLGAGVSFIDVSVYDEDDYWYYYYYDDDYDSDGDIGAWIGAGVHYSPGGGFLIGLTAQYLMGAEVELQGRDFDAGGLDLMLLVGYGF